MVGALTGAPSAGAGAPAFISDALLLVLVVGFFAFWVIRLRREVALREGAERRELARGLILGRLASDAPLREVLELTAQVAERERPGTRCAVVVLDAQGERPSQVFAPGLGPDALAAMEGLAGAAARQVTALPGFAACWSQPIVGSDGRALGTLVLAHPGLATPSVSDLRRLEASARLAGLALERTTATEQRREREALYRLLTEDVLDVVWKTDAALRVTYISPADEPLRGYRADEVVGRHVFEMFTAEGVAAVVQAIERRKTQDAPGQPAGFITFEAAHRCKDGRVIWGEVRSRAERDAAGAIVGYHGITREITARKQAEDALNSSLSLLNATLESTANGILVVDRKGQMTRWNRNFVEMWRVPEALLSTHLDASAIHHVLAQLKDPEAFLARVTDLYEHPEESSVDQLELLDGRTFSRYSQPQRVGDAVVGRVWSFHDITVRRRAEQELQETNRHLEAATRRANDLAAQAELASAAKSEFLANMSHEIRTPMNGVIGMTELLLDTDLGPQQRGYAETVRSCGGSLLTLLNDILDFSKIEAGKLEMESVDFDLRALFEDFAALLALRAHERKLEFICALDPGVPTALKGDPGRLRQVLNNLAGNAVKFTHRGEVSVRVGLVADEGDDVTLRFAVRDTGIGIPVAKQSLLFQKFSQADTSTTREYGGTGLGLAISRQLAVRMGGAIGVSSAAGVGSEFWFTARLGRQRAEQAAGAARERPAPLAGLRVLVVDDNATQREVLRLQCEAWGARVDAVADRVAALEAWRRGQVAGAPHHVCLVDQSLAGPGGVDEGPSLARALRDDARPGPTRVVLMAPLGQQGAASQASDPDGLLALTKPPRHAELLACLSSAGGVGSTTPASSAPPRSDAARHLAGRRGCVLLAEDNLVNQRVAQGLLTKLGLRVDTVGTGAAAVMALARSDYDLVLMDVQMPELDGLEATRAIRDPGSVVRNHGVPVVAMTASAMQGDRERCLAAGMNDYVTKPIALASLVEALARWLPVEVDAGGAAR